MDIFYLLGNFIFWNNHVNFLIHTLKMSGWHLQFRIPIFGDGAFDLEKSRLGPDSNDN
jgi:hypothetical protein